MKIKVMFWFKRETRQLPVKYSLIVLGVVFLFLPLLVLAASGAIDSSYKYAWGSKIGWINFATTNGNIQVTDSEITGYAWNENYGWLNMHPTNGGVHNDGAGVLSGYAWSANLGWLNFSGVTINSSTGKFSGEASGENFSIVNFDCTNCDVRTTWRPTSNQNVGNNTGGGGGGLPSGYTSLPVGPYYLKTVQNTANTFSQNINLEANCGPTAKYVWVGEDLDFVYNSQRTACAPAGAITNISFNLSTSLGLKTVYAMFCTEYGYCSGKLSVNINYLEKPVIPEIKIETNEPTSTTEKLFSNVGQNNSGVLDQIKDLTDKVAEKLSQIKIPSLPSVNFSGSLEKIKSLLFGPEEQTIPELPSLENIVPKETPLVLRGAWEYLPPQGVNKFVFAPLPKEFRSLAGKFPEIKNILQNVGVNKMSDMEKLADVSLSMPGLQQTLSSLVADLPIKKMGGNSFLPLASLTPDLKKKIPAEVVFVRGQDELVDFKVAVSLGDNGELKQKTEAIAGKPMHLAVRPESAVKTVSGYVLFKERKMTAEPVIKFSLTSLMDSWFFAEPVLAQTASKIEERLVLNQFEYVDSDKDGIYTANIVAPAAVGDYEIVTVIDYVDAKLGRKELRLITVVDPEGYIYEKVKNNELRISGATVSLYRWGESSQSFALWSASDYNQENPQLSDSRGAYSFLVPEGKYYLSVKAPGYKTFVGEEFEVKVGGGIHQNVALKSTRWWSGASKYLTGSSLVIIIVLLFVLIKKKRNKIN